MNALALLLLAGGNLVLALVVGLGLWMLWRSATPALRLTTMVLEDWDERPTAPGDLVVVRGRRAGLVSFILGLLGIDPKVRLVVRTNEVELSSTGLLGHSYHRVPILRISSTRTGYARPLHWLMLGSVLILYALLMGGGAGTKIVLALVGGGAGTKIVLALVGLGLLAAFVLGKAAFISISGFGSEVLGIRYRGSILNARTVDLGAAQRLARLLGDLTLGDGSGTARQHQEDAESHSPPPPPVMAYCDYCGRQGLVGTPCSNCQRVVE